MSLFETSQPPWASRMLSVFRIVAGVVFVSFGTMKLFGYPPGLPPIPLLSLYGVAGILEVFGGGLVVLGCLTRPVAFVLSGEMAVAYFHDQAPAGFWPSANGGAAAVMFCFFYLFLVVSGPGVWSVDTLVERALRRRSGTETSVALADRAR
jgi:putative oxidoreductase